MELYEHLLYSRTNSFRRKQEQAQVAIDRSLQAHQGRWYSSFSGGSDSLCMIDLLFSQGVRMPVVWGDDGADFPETLSFLRDTEKRYGFQLIRIRSMGSWSVWCEEMGRPDLVSDPNARNAWINPCEWHDTWYTLRSDAPKHGYSGVFLGLLADESRVRSYRLRGGTRPSYQVKSEQGMWHCSPLAGWTKRDVWGYIAMRGLPYNPAYDILAAQGMSLAQRRVAPLTCWRTMQYGSHVQLRAGWPQLYNRLSATFPHVRTYS